MPIPCTRAEGVSDLLRAPADLRARVRAWRAAGESVALVPTMGDLHAGHLALVDHARRSADRVVVSIFVNPLQFGPNEDYGRYPRVLEHDCARLAEHAVDSVFAPGVDALYPRGTQGALRIRLPGLDDILCGADRPGHFTGVATVVAKLFNIAEPDRAVFGEKDYQQLLLIRRLVAELAFPVTIDGVPTVREADGLALSSRNGYLEAGERAQASELFATLAATAAALAAGEGDHAGLIEAGCERLRTAGFDPRYLEIRRAVDLAEPTASDRPAELRVLAAAQLGRARLIDNVAVPPR